MLGGVETCVMGGNAYEGSILEVLGEQRVCLSFGVCHLRDWHTTQQGAMVKSCGRRDACLRPGFRK